VSGRCREIDVADAGLDMKQSTSSMTALVWNGPQAVEARRVAASGACNNMILRSEGYPQRLGGWWACRVLRAE
jgi:hypothetical protein